MRFPTAFVSSSSQEITAVRRGLEESMATARGRRGVERCLYLDSFDWRLHRDGGALSAEPRAGRQLLRWQRSDGETRHVLEVDRPPEFVWHLPRGAFRSELETVLEMRRLLPRVDLERRWEELRVLDKRRKTVARVRLERARAFAPGAGGGRRLKARIVALPVRGFDRAFGALEDILTSGLGLTRVGESLLEEGLRAVGLEAGDYSAKPAVELAADLPAHEAMRRIHRGLLEVMRRNEDGVRRDLDSEFLHDFRVAVRKTRSALTQVKEVFPAVAVERFRREFAWLQRLTGPLRDLDVYLLKLDGYRDSLPPAVACELGPLEDLLRRHQKAAHRRLKRSLGTKRYAGLLADWEQFLAAEEPPAEPPPAAADPIGRVAARRILARHARVIKKGRAIGPDSPDAKLHRLRIDCKKLRYLLELFRDLYPPKKIGGLIKALKRLQENLGDFNDLSVHQQALTGFTDELAEEGAPAATLIAVGRLVESLERRHADERRRFHRRFGRFDSGSVHDQFRGLFGGESAA